MSAINSVNLSLVEFISEAILHIQENIQLEKHCFHLTIIFENQWNHTDNINIKGIILQKQNVHYNYLHLRSPGWGVVELCTLCA